MNQVIINNNLLMNIEYFLDVTIDKIPRFLTIGKKTYSERHLDFLAPFELKDLEPKLILVGATYKKIIADGTEGPVSVIILYEKLTKTIKLFSDNGFVILRSSYDSKDKLALSLINNNIINRVANSMTYERIKVDMKEVTVI